MVSDELGLDALLRIWRHDLEVQKSAAKLQRNAPKKTPQDLGKACIPAGAESRLAMAETSPVGDVSITFMDEATIRVSSTVLTLASPVFRTMIDGEDGEIAVDFKRSHFEKFS